MTIPLFKKHPVLAPIFALVTGLILFPAFTVWFVLSSQHSLQAQITRNAQHAQQVSDHRWCSTLQLLVTAPEIQGSLKINLQEKQKEFGCL